MVHLSTFLGEVGVCSTCSYVLPGLICLSTLGEKIETVSETVTAGEQSGGGKQVEQQDRRQSEED